MRTDRSPTQRGLRLPNDFVLVRYLSRPPCLLSLFVLSEVQILRRVPFTLLVSVLLAAFIGCKQEASSSPDGPAAEDEVVEVVQKDVPIYSEWVHTTDGLSIDEEFFMIAS